jgi:RNA polymerase sigma-70 factor (ECF subfamily)
MRPTDETLMQQFRDGNKDAFEVLYRRYEKPVLDFIYRMVMDAAEAESLCQEAFFRVVKSRKRYRPTAQFKTWIFQIALNLCRDRLRRLRHRSHLSLNTPVRDHSDEGIEIQDLISDPDQDAVAGLESLPQDEHLVVVMKEYQGMPYSEIAEIMNCPIGTLKSHNYRAHQKLKKILSKYLGD